MPRAPDPQQRPLYAWEGQWADWNSRNIPLKKAREYVNWACGLYNLKPMRVKTHKGGAYSYSQDGLISFNHEQINRAIALHEVAHYICDAIFDDESMPWHGPEFMAVYLWLLIKARVAPRIALTASAEAKGLKWLPLWAVSPKRLAKARGGLSKRRLKPPARF